MSAGKRAMTFSQRMGLKPVRVDLQRESMDEVLRNKIWSLLLLRFFHVLQGLPINRCDPIKYDLFINFFEQPVDQCPTGLDKFALFVRQWFFPSTWNEVYDLLERVHTTMNRHGLGREAEALAAGANDILEVEQSAYRFVEGHVVENTSEVEVGAIEAALSDASPRSAIRRHLETALSMLTDRKKPQYRNSMKESISAVEALCQKITGDDNATLGQALTRLKGAGVEIHPALEKAWKRLYDYTSDADGVRHALTDEGEEPDFEKAMYFLVSCSGFVSYLLAESRKAGLKLA